MSPFFSVHSKLGPFILFSKEHLVTIGLICFFSILLFILKIFFNNIKKMRLFLAFLLLLSDTWQHLWLIRNNAWSVKRDLPLQLSDLSVLLAMIMLLTKSKKLFQFVYFAGMASSIQAILTPDLGKYSFPHFQYIEFFVSHGGVVLSCIFMAIAYCYQVDIQSIGRSIFLVNLYAMVVFLFNKWIGANYLYLMKKPRSASLLNYLGPWPWYMISMELVMIVSFIILYIPFWVKRRYCEDRT